MYSFGRSSLLHIDTLHPDAQLINHEAIKGFDYSVICGHRNEVGQMIALEKGTTQLPWPESKHNSLPSMAFDVAPYPIDWNDRGSFILLAGWLQHVAFMLLEQGRISHRLRSGADWNGNRKTKDQRFHDLPHHELVPIG